MLYKKLIEDNISATTIIKYNGRQYCYQELHQSALALGSKWIKDGVKTADRILVSCNDKVDTVVAMLACMAYGFIFVPSEPESGEQQYIQKDCQPRIVYTGGYNSQNAELIQRKIQPQDTIGYIIYTSGCTGKKKGVVAPLSAINFCIEAINEKIGNTKSDKILSVLSLSFDYGLYQVFLALRYGATLTLVDGNTKLIGLPRIAHEHGITALPVVPTMLIKLYPNFLKPEYFPNLRYICSTGEVFDVNLIEKVHNDFPDISIIPMYGLTECKRVSIMPPDRWDKIKAGSCGVPLEGTQVKLIDEKDGMGELIVYGPHVMNGYWGDMQASSEIYCVDCQGRRFLRTGDSFSIDDEGFLYFKYRIKNIIKVSGYTVSATELEQRLKMLDDIIEVCVAGLPCGTCGETICAYVRVAQEQKKEKVKEEIKGISAQLQHYKQIKRIAFYDEPFPTNSNGKMDIKALQQRAGNGNEL